MACTTKSREPQSAFRVLEDRIHRGAIRDVARQDMLNAGLGRKRLHPFFQRLALIGESHFRALVRRSFRDTPGDRPVVRDAHHQAALALHQKCCLSHFRSPCYRRCILHINIIAVKC